jgi:hypothetical protein
MFRSNPERWAKTRKLGRKQFVLRFGVLAWGVPTGILFALRETQDFGWSTFPLQLLLAMMIFPLAGVVWGRAMWWLMERLHGRQAGKVIE